MSQQKPGCSSCVGGCLAIAALGGIAFVIAAIMVSLNLGPKTPDPTPVATATAYPYPFHKRGKDNSSPPNVMDFYTFSEPIDLEQLKAFCADRKRSAPGEAFYYVVLVDDPKNAVFPTIPYTARWGMDLKPLKHIRAIYEYNKVNGYSKLEFYGKNAADSRRGEFDIP